MTDLIKPYQGEDEIAFAKRKAYFIKYIKSRLDYSDKLMVAKLANTTPINSIEKQEIDDFWRQYLPPVAIEKFIDYRYYDFFKTVQSEGEKLYQYVTHSFFAFIDDYYTDPQNSAPCDDKNLYDLYFYDVKRPKTIFRKIRGMFLDENYHEITFNEAIRLAKKCEEVVLKVGKFSFGGDGILFWNSINSDESQLLEFLQKRNNVICQETIRQHKELCRLNPTSVNTIRIMTLLYDGQIYALSSVIRMGTNDSRVDNGSSGGIVCGILPNGQLKSYARDICGNTFLQHPRGTKFESVIIPNFEECIELVTTLAGRFSALSRLLSWDLAIDESGHPVLIEVSLSGGGLDVHHVCNGPAFGTLIHEVVSEVCNNSFSLKSIIRSLDNNIR